MEGGRDRYKQIDRIVLRDNPVFEKVCAEFHFVDQEGKNRDRLMFANRNEVFILNVVVGDIQTVYKFKDPLKRQPANFDINDAQNIFVVASADDGLYINTEEKKEEDIDDIFGIGLIKNIKFESETREFYILCNREGTALGFYVLRFSEKDIHQNKFLIKF